jgi:hypothetical protein
MADLHPGSNYSRFNLPTFTDGPLTAEAAALDNVEGRFRRLSTRGDHLAAVDSGVFKPPRYVRYTWIEEEGNVGRNHLQGLQRRGNYLFVSGSDATEPTSHIFIIHMASRPANGSWGSNLLFRAVPDPADGLVRVVALDRDLSHAGGLSLLGDILAVPLEGDEKRKLGSKVIFLHVGNPQEPKRLPEATDIVRPKIAKAGAVALTRLPDRRFLCAVWREDTRKRPPGHMDLYLSRTEDLLGGFDPRPLTIQFRNPYQGRQPEYQTIAFLSPQAVAGGPPGRISLYMIATENASSQAPWSNGENWADLYAVELTPWPVGSAPATANIRIAFVKTLEFHCGSEYGNFDAAAAIHISDKGLLSLYGGYHWRVSQTFRFAEFQGRPDPASAVTEFEDAWIELYEHPDFRGRCLSIVGTNQSTIRDYSRIFVDGGDFDDVVSSVRLQIPDRAIYRLFRHAGFQGNRTGIDYLDLVGTGRLKEISDLKKNPYRFGDHVQSSRYSAP